MTNEIHKFFKVGAFLCTTFKAGGMREMRLQYYLCIRTFLLLWFFWIVADCAYDVSFLQTACIIHIQIPLRMNTPSQCNLKN